MCALSLSKRDFPAKADRAGLRQRLVVAFCWSVPFCVGSLSSVLSLWHRPALPSLACSALPLSGAVVSHQRLPLFIGTHARVVLARPRRMRSSWIDLRPGPSCGKFPTSADFSTSAANSGGRISDRCGVLNPPSHPRSGCALHRFLTVCTGCNRGRPSATYVNVGCRSRVL
jgi:hypothetical protein